MKFKKGQSYGFNEIEKSVENTLWELIDNENFEIGIGFIYLKNYEKDQVVSFILTGYSNLNAIYECVYTDI